LKKKIYKFTYIGTVKNALSKLFIGHNRLTSAGLESRVEGSHPFQITANEISYAMSHNGTIYDFVDAAKKRNTSDSFIFMEHLILQNETNTPNDVFNRLQNISSVCDYSSMTGFLISPNQLFVWRVFNDKDLSKAEKRNLYYTLYMKLNKDSVIISSEPLDDSAWALLPNYSFLSLTPINNHIEINFSSLK
jgi:predicted glutamine amidotransferase